LLERLAERLEPCEAIRDFRPPAATQEDWPAFVELFARLRSSHSSWPADRGTAIARDKGIDRGRIEVWFADEARIGQKNKITRRWARRGTRPSAPHDQRTASTYIFGAICPGEGKGAALVLPACNTEAMNLHLAEIANEVAPSKHAVLVLDQAGWHLSARLALPDNVTLIVLPPNARNSTPPRTSGSSCATTGSRTGCSPPTPTLSTIAARPGTSSHRLPRIDPRGDKAAQSQYPSRKARKPLRRSADLWDRPTRMHDRESRALSLRDYADEANAAVMPDKAGLSCTRDVEVAPLRILSWHLLLARGRSGAAEGGTAVAPGRSKAPPRP
jgi:hypothetical protein